MTKEEFYINCALVFELIFYILILESVQRTVIFFSSMTNLLIVILVYVIYQYSGQYLQIMFSMF